MRKRGIFQFIAFILCLAAMAICLLWVELLSSQLIGQTEAELWQQGDMPYIQHSAFISEDRALDVSGVQMIHYSIDQALITESIEAENDTARLWIDAYSGETSMTAASGGKSVAVRTICTGGDFFTFNPIEMLGGWYYSDTDIMDDGVIIDKNLAWQLYGGFELSGMNIEINGYPCLIVGVADLPSSDILADAYGQEPTVYLPLSLCDRLGSAPNITYYSLVLPNPVKGFGEKIFTENCSLDEKEYELTENTARFSVLTNLKRVAETGKRTQRTTKIYFPWWENGARFAESWCTVLTVIAALFAIWPLICIIIIIVHTVLRRKLIIYKTKGYFDRIKNKKKKENHSVMEENNEKI